MIELIVFAFSPLNVVFTLLLILMVLYWLAVIIGALDIDLFNVELPDAGLEGDMDVDVGDLDADADGNIDLEGVSDSLGRSVLHFFYIGEVPVMILLSLFIISLWSFSILGNYYLNPARSFLIAIPIFVGNLILSLLVVKAVAAPLRKVFVMFNKDADALKDVVGRICTVTTTTATKDKMGQAEVSTKGAPVILNVLSQTDHEFKKGDEAVLVEKDETKGIYLIAPVDLEG
jgi:hypothetical protein